jgi:hypothetical protein
MFAIFNKHTIDFANEVPAGFKGTFRTNVTLEIPDDFDEWPDGAEAPQRVIGESVGKPGNYRMFIYERDMARSGYWSTGKTLGNQYMIYPGTARS